MRIRRLTAFVFLICGGACLVATCLIAVGGKRSTSTAVGATVDSPGPLVVLDGDIEIRSEIPKDGDIASTNKTTVLVRNKGESLVRIVSLESNCGCTSADIQPKNISPGAVARVFLQIKPIRRGGRDVAIRLHTDSVAQPIAEIHVRVLGSDPPPYLLATNGDLQFSGDEAADDARLLVVKTVVPRGVQAREPFIRSDMQGLEWTLESVESKPAIEADTTSYLYRYHVRFSGPPAAQTRGYVHVGDPWDEDHVESLLCVAEVPPALRVVPTHLLLTANRARPEKTHGALLVRTKGDPNQISVICEQPTESPLRVRRIASADGSHSAVTFEITVAQEFASSQGSWRLFVKDDSLDQAAIEVPVRLVFRD